MILRLLRYLDTRRRTLWLATAASVLNKLWDLAPPALIGLAVDTVVEQRTSWLADLGVVDPYQQLLVIAALTVAIWSLESVFEYIANWLWRTLAQDVQHDLRMDAYRHVQTLDLSWFHERSTGRLMAILNDDVNQLERFLNGGADAVLQTFTAVVLVCAVFFWVSPNVAALAMLPIPFILAGSFVFQARIAPRYAEVREKAAQVNGQLANNLGGIATIQAFTAEGPEADRLSGLSKDYVKANRSAIMLSSAFSPLIRIFVLAGFTVTLVVGGWQALSGVIEVGAYSTLVFLTQRLLWPLTRLGEIFDTYQRAMASAGRILDLLDTQAALPDGTVALEPVGAITFSGVHFAYPEREPVLTGVDLSIEAGQTVGIVGSTGAGKSTLVRLLLRFHAATEGTVSVDGQPVGSLTRASLRGAIGLVAQSTFLFDGSVADNLRMGRPGATEDELWSALDAAEAQAFVQDLPHGLLTQIGERGVKLSGGQRQRLALARAVLKDPPILILDEATSAVDNETEAAIQRSLQHVGASRTVIVIAHRLSTVRDADRIVVVDQGRIVEEGTHDALVHSQGTYAQLWRIQTGART